MKYKYDAETDILVISLSNEEPDFAEQKENIITHYTKEGKPVEIEILDARDSISIMSDIVRKTKSSKTI